MKKETIFVRKKYDRFSKFYDFLESGVEKSFLKNHRKNLLKNLSGKVLEIGIGTGKNLEYYNKNLEVIGIDLSPKMLNIAKIKLNKMKNKKITLLEMDAENLKFKDNSFDYIVCTFVLCSVPDPIKTIKEMSRVLKKNGKIVMMEHVKSKIFLIKILQNIHNPISKLLLGVNINRDTILNIKKAGLKPNYKNIAFYDVFKKIIIKNN